LRDKHFLPWTRNYSLWISFVLSVLSTKMQNRTLLFSNTRLKHGLHFDYRNQPLNMRMSVCYLDCHETGLCCYLVIQIGNLWRPLQLFYFRLWPIYWLCLLAIWLLGSRMCAEVSWSKMRSSAVYCDNSKEQNFKFSHRWLWRILSSGIQRRVVRWKSTDVSEERVVSFFTVEATNQYALLAICFMLLSCSAYSLTPKRRLVPPKPRSTFFGLCGVESQKVVLFITTGVKI
jgi:hypothetical protein